MHRIFRYIKKKVSFEYYFTKQALHFREHLENDLYRKNDCPLCESLAYSDDPPFVINKRKQVFYCFDCHAGGDIIEFVKRYEGCSTWEVVDKLVVAFDLDLSKAFKTQRDFANWVIINMGNLMKQVGAMDAKRGADTEI